MRYSLTSSEVVIDTLGRSVTAVLLSLVVGREIVPESWVDGLESERLGSGGGCEGDIVFFEPLGSLLRYVGAGTCTEGMVSFWTACGSR